MTGTAIKKRQNVATAVPVQMNIVAVFLVDAPAIPLVPVIDSGEVSREMVLHWDNTSCLSPY